MKTPNISCVLIIILFCEAILANSLINNISVNPKDVGSPLLLIPLIETGRLLEAKQKAYVSHAELQNIESYAGYFTVNKEYNSNLFFWFFPSQTTPKSDPVVLWLQGGPGSPSLFGLFTGNGPIAVSENNTLEFRKYYWSLNHNVIYIDSPVGTGYSFTDNESGYATSEVDVARDLYAALTQFFDLFPELRSNEFYATGESYAGKYIPALCNEIRNKNMQAKKKINLVGLAIGNGWTDPINQIDYSEYLYHIGLVDNNGKQIFKTAENKIKDLIRTEQYAEASKVLRCTILGYCETNNSTLLQKITGYKVPYNYLFESMPNQFSKYETWVQQPHARKAIHVGSKNFNARSLEVFNHLNNVFCRSMAPVLADLIQHYRVLIYTGQLDIICAYPLVENYLNQLEWPGAEEYRNAERKQWWIENDLAGYTKSVRNLTEVLIRNSGHMVPSNEPFWAWKMISNFIRHKDL